jgi:hypothetical protein
VVYVIQTNNVIIILLLLAGIMNATTSPMPPNMQSLYIDLRVQIYLVQFEVVGEREFMEDIRF